MDGPVVTLFPTQSVETLTQDPGAEGRRQRHGRRALLDKGGGRPGQDFGGSQFLQGVPDCQGDLGLALQRAGGEGLQLSNHLGFQLRVSTDVLSQDLQFSRYIRIGKVLSDLFQSVILAGGPAVGLSTLGGAGENSGVFAGLCPPAIPLPILDNSRHRLANLCGRHVVLVALQHRQEKLAWAVLLQLQQSRQVFQLAALDMLGLQGLQELGGSGESDSQGRQILDLQLEALELEIDLDDLAGALVLHPHIGTVLELHEIAESSDLLPDLRGVLDRSVETYLLAQRCEAGTFHVESFEGSDGRRVDRRWIEKMESRGFEQLQMSVPVLTLAQLLVGELQQEDQHLGLLALGECFGGAVEKVHVLWVVGQTGQPEIFDLVHSIRRQELVDLFDVGHDEERLYSTAFPERERDQKRWG